MRLMQTKGRCEFRTSHIQTILTNLQAGIISAFILRQICQGLNGMKQRSNSHHFSQGLYILVYILKTLRVMEETKHHVILVVSDSLI